ncbi:MAG TPA: hypothetical protein VNB91_10920 [Jatrophihabitantaceae bacterium]|jgi:hypothetical protein|nr:hypothetical protein [Jatrophihabitantaceae bacterium]
MKSRKRSSIAALAVLLLAVFLGSALVTGTASASGPHPKVRWDIISIDFAAHTISAGGHASAIAQNGQTINLTGSGTFVAGRKVGDRHVTGGGTWQTFDPAGTPTAQGTYQVTNFVSFEVAPGAAAAGLTDLIGDPATARAGLAFLTVRYSDGSTGVLTVSCRIPGPPAAPDTLFEGIRVSMGFVDYWNGTEPPAPPANGNRTLFHIVGKH